MSTDNEDVSAVEDLWSAWNQTRQWACKLLEEKLQLSNAEQVLQRPHRGSHQVPGTQWVYKTHGIGVDLSKPGNKGGIDFDFGRPDPDAWRLREFLIKQYNDGALVKKRYRALLEDKDRWHRAFCEATRRQENSS